jgi:hypothetical protein
MQIPCTLLNVALCCLIEQKTRQGTVSGRLGRFVLP